MHVYMFKLSQPANVSSRCTPSASASPTLERVTTESPDYLNKSHNFLESLSEETLKKIVKQLQQIQNHLCRLATSMSEVSPANI